jgi:Ulp1 family protease
MLSTCVVYGACQGRDETCANQLLKYILEEAKVKGKKDWDGSKWKKLFPHNIPQQALSNDKDCGMFTTMYADYVALEKPWDFGQKDMPYLRCKVRAHGVTAL